jgi:hypothetical protein
MVTAYMTVQWAESALGSNRYQDVLYNYYEEDHLPLTELPSGLATALEVWRAADRRNDLSLPHRLQLAGIDPTCAVLADTAGDGLRFTSLGKDLTTFGADWPTRGIGRRLDQLPDKTYAAHLAPAFQAIVQMKVPAADRVTAVIYQPDEHGDVQPTWRVHDRIVLPLETDRGPALLASRLIIENHRYDGIAAA